MPSIVTRLHVSLLVMYSLLLAQHCQHHSVLMQ
jgi:hypothetical protein